jgi:hypothetical protein
VGRIVFVGRVPHGEMDRYCDVIDVLVYPRWRMRLTELVTILKPLESMAMAWLVGLDRYAVIREAGRQFASTERTRRKRVCGYRRVYAALTGAATIVANSLHQDER